MMTDCVLSSGMAHASLSKIWISKNIRKGINALTLDCSQVWIAPGSKVGHLWPAQQIPSLLHHQRAPLPPVLSMTHGYTDPLPACVFSSNPRPSTKTSDDPYMFPVTRTNWYIPTSSWSLLKIENGEGVSTAAVILYSSVDWIMVEFEIHIIIIMTLCSSTGQVSVHSVPSPGLSRHVRQTAGTDHLATEGVKLHQAHIATIFPPASRDYQGWKVKHM